jgi:uncharacterized tellurite resistance protein B-like protein
MLKTLRDLFDALAPAPSGAAPADETHALQLAAAVLLVEVMRADSAYGADERRVLLAALREKFALADDEAARLSELAEHTARQSTDLFAFTERINRHFDMPRKLRMIEMMWQVAYADGELGAHERHMVWRIADLLHVPQGALQHARVRAKGG